MFSGLQSIQDAIFWEDSGVLVTIPKIQKSKLKECCFVLNHNITLINGSYILSTAKPILATGNIKVAPSIGRRSTRIFDVLLLGVENDKSKDAIEYFMGKTQNFKELFKVMSGLSGWRPYGNPFSKEGYTYWVMLPKELSPYIKINDWNMEEN
jgi:hypothetical protein